MLTNLLRSFQLNEKEILIFTKLLELGPQPASRIAKICELPRNTVRSILDALVKKGLMTKSVRAKTQYYATEGKNGLLRTLKLKKMRMEEEISQQIELLESYGEELSVRHFAKSRPRITFYEGIAGLEKVYEDTLTAKTGLKSWASTDDMLQTMPRYFRSYFKRRTTKEIPMRSIHPESSSAKDITKRNLTELRESALVPPEKYSWTPEVQIYNNKVNIASWKEKLGIIIESEEIADAMRAFFDLSFERAKVFGKHGGIRNYEELTQRKKQRS
jgi:sugar-specific transcriptional regulator TrmB